MISIQDSVARYEAKLRSVLKGDLVESDLQYKHHRMRKDPFLFLRATCWRWSEIAGAICPDLANAPRVLSVGDAHVENFGIWRDTDGRLVWGVNDFDEAGSTPYPFDLVRLGTSALLASGGVSRAPDIADAILQGYRTALRDPRPFILDDAHYELRNLFAVAPKGRVRFWEKIAKLRTAKPRKRYATALREDFPDPKLQLQFKLRRRAGMGSLGRPRFVAIGMWRGGLVVREAKAVVPSCFSRARSPDLSGKTLLRAAGGVFRAPDPWLHVRDGVVIRRLGPNSRKLELAEIGQLTSMLLAAMGSELANIHMGDVARAAFIAPDLSKRPGTRWLEKAIKATAAATLSDWKEYRRSSS